MTIHNNKLQDLVRVKDNLEAIGAVLRDNNGVPIDLTGEAITFRLVNTKSAAIVIDDKSAVIDSASEGQVHYQPTGSEMSTPGSYAAYFKIVGNPARRFPYDGAKFTITIVEETKR